MTPHDLTSRPASTPRRPLHVVVYGAATQLPADFGLGIQRRPGRQLRLARDRWMARLGSARYLRYESYVSDRSINMGDLAIADAVHGLVTQVLGDEVRVSRVNWEQALPEDPVDLLLVSGSGYLALDAQGQLPLRIVNDAQAWQARQIPYAFVGVGINQLLSGAGEALTIKGPSQELLRRLLDGSCGVSVRDRATCEALSTLTRHPVALIGDPALHLPPMLAEPTSPRRSGPQRLQVGINLPLHGPDAARRIRDEFPVYVQFLRDLQRRLDCDYHFISHFECSTVLPSLFAMQGLKMALAYGPPAELAHTYRQLDLHLGGKLHSCILASGFGVPNVGLAYDRKHFGFFELMGGAERCVAAQPLPSPRLLTLLPQVRDQRLQVRHQLLQRQQALRALTVSFLSDVLLGAASPALARRIVP